MIAGNTITTIQLSVAAVTAAIALVKFVRIHRFNSQAEEPLPMNLFGIFSSMEMDGTYVVKKRKLMRFCNSMSVLIYFCVFIMIVAQMFPYILRKMGID